MSSNVSCLFDNTSRYLRPVVQLLPDTVKHNPRYTAAAVAAVALSGLWACRNYLAFKSIGPGGLPHKAGGWLIALDMKRFARETTSTGEYDHDSNKESWLKDKEKIPARGERPLSSWHVAPARQSNQIPAESIVIALDRFFKQLVELDPTLLESAQSPHERLNKGITINSAIQSVHDVAQVAFREIAHVHPADHSLHVLLALQDCKFVIERGWGRRHHWQLSGSRGLRVLPLPTALKAARIPKEYIWVYAPRDLQELEVAKLIVVAGLKYMPVIDSKDVVVPQ